MKVEIDSGVPQMNIMDAAMEAPLRTASHAFITPRCAEGRIR